MAAAMSRMRMKMPVREALPAAAWSLPIDWMVMGLAAALWLTLWTTSTKVLLTSDMREGGHALACRYFTGVGMIERQYLHVAGDAARHACPFVRRGGG